MEELVRPFEERYAEIAIYLDFLDGLDTVMKSGVPRLGGPEGPVVTVQQQRMLFSSVYLQLYNLVEATLTSCLDAISKQAVVAGGWLPIDLTAEVRQEWVRRMAQTHTEMAAETRLRRAIMLCDHLVASLPMDAFEVEKGGGGNWDDEEIWRMAQRLGVALNLSREANAGVKRVVRDDLGAMKLIVSLRNKLAHGSLSFVECGQYDTAAQLRQIAESVAAYMREIVDAFSFYILTHGYLRPESRPAAIA